MSQNLGYALISDIKGVVGFEKSSYILSLAPVIQQKQAEAWKVDKSGDKED